MKLCSIDECLGKARRKNLCDKHYERWRVHGDPLKIIDRKPSIEMLRNRLKLLMSQDDNGCINYLGAKRKNGYGAFNLFGKTIGAHRAAYELFVAPVPLGSMICHSCDNRLCINPKHLWIGNQESNMADMVIKKRSSHGIRNVKNKLSEDEVIIIKKRLLKKEKIVILAKEFNVSATSISAIKRGHNWKHIII